MPSNLVCDGGFYHERRVLIESEHHRYSNCHYIGIILDMPDPFKHQIAHTLKPNHQYSLILAAALKPRSQGTGVQDPIKENLPDLQFRKKNPTLPIVALNTVPTVLRPKTDSCIATYQQKHAIM